MNGIKTITPLVCDSITEEKASITGIKKINLSLRVLLDNKLNKEIEPSTKLT